MISIFVSTYASKSYAYFEDNKNDTYYLWEPTGMLNVFLKCRMPEKSTDCKFMKSHHTQLLLKKTINGVLCAP